MRYGYLVGGVSCSADAGTSQHTISVLFAAVVALRGRERQ